MKKYEFRSDVALSDCAFYAYGKNAEELIVNACNATTEAMVNREEIEEKDEISFEIKAESLEELLYFVLEEVVFLKDSKQFVCHNPKVENFEEKPKSFSISMKFLGEKLDRKKHESHSDVKAVTYHQFEITKTPTEYRASVILDV